MRQRRFARQLHRHRAIGRAGIHAALRVKLDAHVFEIDARDMQREPAFLAAAYRCVEIDQFGFCHAKNYPFFISSHQR